MTVMAVRKPKWDCLFFSPLSFSSFFLSLPVLIQARLRRCQPPPPPWTSSSSLSRTIAFKTWWCRPTCTPRSSRSASVQTRAGVPWRHRRWRRSWASSSPPACTAASQCSASGAQASSATGASPWRWVSLVLRRSSSTSTSWLSGRRRGATRACTRSSHSWTRCSSRSAAPSDPHRHRWVPSALGLFKTYHIFLKTAPLGYIYVWKAKYHRPFRFYRL